MTQLLANIPAAVPAAQITISLLGPPRIELDGLPLTFAYEKVQVLLVYLALEADRAHSRMALADLLWPEQSEAAARHSLSQALFQLRRTLNDDPANPLVLTTRTSVRLSPNRAIWLDVAAFKQLLHGTNTNTQQLRQAIALYRGEFLEGWSIGGSVVFEEWMLLMREHLHVSASNALRQLTEPHVAGNPTDVCDNTRRWIALDPLCEEAYRRLMRALADSGQRTAALAQFAHCQRILQAEMGIEPELATIALYEELKHNTVPVLSRPAPSARARLPLPTTRLIDRECDLTELTTLLNDPTNRLITISGPGGVGKTRLALEVASANTPRFADGVCFVPLAPIREPAQVLVAVAQALGVLQNDARPLKQHVRAELAQRHLLLLLDNCEHVLPAVAALVAELLAAAPMLVVLATSRVTLRLSHEHRYQVAPLSLDGDQAGGHSAQSGAVALFVERSQVARPAVELDYDAIAAICRRLDGLPLAIELAATRTRLLNPRELLARLEQRLPLLNGGPRDTPERHQTLHATIDWSYQLLDAGQQALFRRLATFAGGWTVDAAEAVCADLSSATSAGASVLDGLVGLLDASLINEMSDGAGELRCTMLETIREYAQAQLVAHGEWEHAQDLHVQYVGALAAQAAAELSGPKQLAWLQRLDAELDNIRTALCWCSEHDVGAGLRLASDLQRYWVIRGHRREGRDWLEALLRHVAQPDNPAPTTEERAYGLLIAGMLAMFLNDFEPATNHLRESYGLYHQLEDQQKIAWVLNNLGNVAVQQGAYLEAEWFYRESLALRRELNHTVGMASSLHNLAEVTRVQGDLHAAKDYFEQSLTFYRQIGDLEASAQVVGHVATILLQQGEYAQAQQLYEASLMIVRELGSKPGLRQILNGLGNVARMQRRYGEAKGHYRQSLTFSAEIQSVGAVTLGLFCFAAIAWAEQHVERAAVLLSAAAALNHSAQLTHKPDDIAEFEEHLALVRAALDAATFDAAWQRGQELTLEQAVALALGERNERS